MAEQADAVLCHAGGDLSGFDPVGDFFPGFIFLQIAADHVVIDFGTVKDAGELRH